MPLEIVELEVGGRSLQIKEITIEAGAEQAVRTAKVKLAPSSLRQALKVRWGEAAVVRAGGEPLVTGWVRDVNASHDGSSHEVGFGIASKTCDETECGIDHETGHVEKATISEILRQYGAAVEVLDRGALPVVPYHQCVPAETRYRSIERIARRQGAVIHDDGQGRLVIAVGTEGRHSGGLSLGVNIRSASASYSEVHRYSKIVVKGQAARGHGRAALATKATAADSEVSRERVRVIILEGDVSADDIKRRADTQRRRAAGLSLAMVVETPGWRDQGGVLWTPNYLVYVDDPAVGVAQDMAIKAVTYSQGAETVARLQLCDPRALGGEDPKGSSAGKTGVGTEEPEVEVEE